MLYSTARTVSRYCTCTCTCTLYVSTSTLERRHCVRSTKTVSCRATPAQSHVLHRHHQHHLHQPNMNIRMLVYYFPLPRSSSRLPAIFNLAITGKPTIAAVISFQVLSDQTHIPVLGAIPLHCPSSSLPQMPCTGNFIYCTYKIAPKGLPSPYIPPYLWRLKTTTANDTLKSHNSFIKFKKNIKALPLT